MPELTSVDERLIALAMRRTGGAKEIFRRIKDEGQLEGWDNQELFVACREVFESMKRKAMIIPADLVAEKLTERGSKPQLAEKLERINAAEVSPTELEATIIAVSGREHSRKINEKVGSLKQMMQSVEQVDVDAAKALAREITELASAKSGQATDRLIPLVEILEEVDHIEEMPDCVSTGFPMWDEQLGGGFIKGSYHILAGHTGTGKSILMLSIYMNMLRAGLRPIYVNYEIARPLFMKFLFAQVTGVNVMKHGLDKDYLEHKKDEFRATVEDLYERGLLLLTDPMQGSPKEWHDVEDMLRELTDVKNADCIFFDTINSVTAATKNGQSARWNEYETIGIASERMCQELNIPVVYSAQPKQDVVLREDKRPQLYDVAGGKVISEKAATITHLHRTDMLDTTRQIKYSELVITKNRVLGQEMTFADVRVKYDSDYKRLYELPPGEQSTPIVDLTGIGPEGPFLDGSSIPGGAAPIDLQQGGI